MDQGDRTRRRWGADAKVGLARLWARAKQIATTDPTGSDDDDRVVESAGERALAKHAAELKGGVAKAAQLAAYASSAPELCALWDAVPAMPAEVIAQVIAAELGAPPEQVFASWDPAPLAAASLGQVHAARDRDGRPLAVKVQYPGIADALASDLASDGFARRLAGSEIGEGLSPEAIAVLRRAVIAELDYQTEAAALDRLGALWRGDPEIRIPEVVASASTRRVLTMTRAPGGSLAAAAAGPAELRAAVSRAIVRFAWATPLRYGVFNADPNPGNYLVDDRGDGVATWFLDFGCTVDLDEAVAHDERELWHGILDDDRAAGAERFRMSLARLGALRRINSMASTAHRDWERALAAPFATDEAFAWDRDYHAELSRATRQVLAAGGLAVPPALTLLWRARLGVSAVIAMLAPRARFRPLLKEVLGSGRQTLR